MKISCDAQELMLALQSVKKMIDIGKRYNNLLLDVKDDKLYINYSDGLHSYTKSIVANVEEEGMVGIEYDRLISIINCCVPSGTLSVKPIEISVNENNIMEVGVIKFINAGDLEGQEVSTMKYKVNVVDPSSDVKYGILTRMNYEDIFVADSWDSWDKNELKDLIGLLVSDEKDTVIYISAKDSMGKVKNLNYGSLIKAKSAEENGFAVRTSTAVPIMDIIGRMEGDIVQVSNVDNRFCKIKDTKDTGIWFEMASGNRIDARAFETYSTIEVNDIKMKIHKGAFQGALEAMSSTSSADKHKLKVVKSSEGDGYALKIMSTSAGGSVVSEINVEIEAIKCGEGVDPLKYEAVMLMKTFKTLMQKCQFDWLMLSVNLLENRFAKIVDIEDVDGSLEEKASYFAVLETE